MPPSKDKGHGRRKTYKGPASDKAVRQKPYTRLNKNGGLDPKARPAAASRTASKLSALGLSSLGLDTNNTLTNHSSTQISAAPRPPTNSQLVTQKMKDEDLIEDLDANMDVVVAALNQRQEEKKKAKAQKGQKYREVQRVAETRQKEFEKVETDMDAALASFGKL